MPHEKATQLFPCYVKLIKFSYLQWLYNNVSVTFITHYSSAVVTWYNSSGQLSRDRIKRTVPGWSTKVHFISPSRRSPCAYVINHYISMFIQQLIQSKNCLKYTNQPTLIKRIPLISPKVARLIGFDCSFSL